MKKISHDEQVQSSRQHTDPTFIEKFMFKFLGPTTLFGNRTSKTNISRVGQVSIEYSTSPLTDEHLGTRGIKAGERASDAKPVQILDKNTGSLFHLLY